MRKTVLKEKAKGILTMGVLVGMFGAFLAGVSNYALAAGMADTVVIPTTYQEGFQIRGAASDYVKGNYAVIENERFPAPNSYALSASEAAELGAQYLWDMFGVDMDGKAISMMYSTDPGRAISYWHGEVYDSESDMVSMQAAISEMETKLAAGYDVESIENIVIYWPKYNFSIEAITGERDSVQYNYEEVAHESVLYKFAETDNYYKNNNQEFLDSAKAAAAKQLETEPVSAEYVSTATCYVGEDFPEDGEVLVSYIYLNIMVTDANGNQALVSINTYDSSLLGITNVYKGVNYDPNSLG